MRIYYTFQKEMIIELKDILKYYGKPVKGVIHIGAHYGQEYDAYVPNGVKNMMFFEPLTANYEKLINKVGGKPGVTTYQLALGNIHGRQEMFVEGANHGMSSSLLNPKLHLEYYPHIEFTDKEMVEITRLDDIPFDRSLYDMINIDVQGYELEVFKGGLKTLRHIDIVYTEINTKEVYEGCAMRDELDNFLGRLGFVRELDSQLFNDAWGDAVYFKR